MDQEIKEEQEVNKFSQIFVRVGWVIIALLVAFAFISIIWFSLIPSTNHLNDQVDILREDNVTLLTENEEMSTQLGEAKAAAQDAASIASENVERVECRNKYDVLLEEATVLNSIAQNQFVASLAGQLHGQTIQFYTTALEESSAALAQALENRKLYESNGALLPCPI